MLSKKTLEEREAWLRKRMAKQAEAALVPPRPAPPPPSLESLQLLKVPEVARLLSVSERSVQRWFARRSVRATSPPRRKGTRPRRLMLIPQKEVARWIEEHSTAGS